MPLFELFWYKVFVRLKIENTQFPDGFCLNLLYLNSNDRTSISIQKWFQLWEKDSHPSIYCSNIICSRINTFIQIASYLIQLLLSLFLTQYSPIFSTNCHLFKVNSNTWRLGAYHYFSPFKTFFPTHCIQC